LYPLSRVAPEYPRDAARRSVEGAVKFQVDVNPDGTVAALKVLEAQPPGVFEKAAERALRKWKFRPKIVDGKAVASSGTQVLEFRLTPKAN
jgi:periplasmic protein TonB